MSRRSRSGRKVHKYLHQLPRQETGDDEGERVQSESRDLELGPLCPVHGEEVHATCSVGDDPTEVVMELVGVDELEASPTSGEHVREEGSDTEQDVNESSKVEEEKTRTDMCGGDSLRIATIDITSTHTEKATKTMSSRLVLSTLAL